MVLQTFNELENFIYQYVCNLGIALFQEIIKKYEEKVHDERDKKIYIGNGVRKTNLKTIFGTVEYKRHIYLNRITQKYEFLLDSSLELETVGTFSNNLVNKMVELISEMSYRQAEEKLELLTNNRISHQSFWNIIQQLGDDIKNGMKQDLEDFEQDKLNGTIQTKVIYEEHDGVWLKMQARERTKKKKSQSSEMKVGIFYTGWSNDKTQRYPKLLNKIAIAGYFTADKFLEMKESLAYSVYDMNSVKHRLVNADGAAWTSAIYTDKVIFQLDSFHVHKAIVRGVRDKAWRKKLHKLFDERKYNELIIEFEEYLKTLTEKKEKKRTREMLEYIKNNRVALPRWQEQIKLENTENVQHRNMGVQENQNYLLITRRMKHRKMSWSKAGATNLALVLCERINSKTINKNKIFLKNVKTKTIKKASEKIRNKIRKEKIKGETSFKGHIPLLKTANTFTSKALRNLSIL